MSLPNEPITRKEQYLAKAAGQDVEIPAKPITREEEYLDAIAKKPGGGGGTSDYSQLENKPQINGVTLTGNKSASDLSLASANDLAGKTNTSVVGTVESSATASKAYAANAYLVLGGVLYRVTSDIASGGTIVTSGAGQNVVATTITAEMEAVEIDYEDWQLLTPQQQETGNWFITNFPATPVPPVDYSTSEVNTGVKWIDGKDVYRKVIDLGALPNNTYKDVSSGLSNVTIISMQTIAVSNNGNAIPIPYASTASNNIVEFFYVGENNAVRVRTGTDRSTQHGYCILEYTKSTT